MDMINVKINGISVSAPKGSTVLDAARKAGIEIPTLCFMKDLQKKPICKLLHPVEFPLLRIFGDLQK